MFNTSRVQITNSLLILHVHVNFIQYTCLQSTEFTYAVEYILASFFSMES